jgi:hypothetical protein
MQIMNMKPHEILSLLEEASGTKLYERKKDSAMKTLSKKQTKLDEIDEVCCMILLYQRVGLEHPAFYVGIASGSVSKCQSWQAS